MSFGGYVSAPVIIAGWILRIPVLIHEQTLVPGKANKLLSRFAKEIYLSWEDSKRYFPSAVQKKCTVTGNPVRKEIRDIINTRTYSKKVKKIYITGGSTGAHRINVIIEQMLEELTSRYTIVHQCGDSHFRDYERLLRKKETLSSMQSQNYSIYNYIDGDKLTDILRHTDILIGRSGANTIIETAVLGIPAIFVPLPESEGNEQYRQAEMMIKQGGSILIAQDQLTPETITTALNTIEQSIITFQHHAQKFSKTEINKTHATAHKVIADRIGDYLGYVESVVSEKT
jgi:UDP-N-acetylglucosamine--N-acetylmuramyl-(pentapeptide) pyrophosphoryl-undecaprenol N-acetylglucosamine transferase